MMMRQAGKREQVFEVGMRHGQSQDVLLSRVFAGVVRSVPNEKFKINGRIDQSLQDLGFMQLMP